MLLGAGAVVVIALAGIAMFNPGQTPSGDAAGEQLEELTIGYVAAPLTSPHYTAVEEGFYRDAGFDVDFREMAGPQIPKAIASGDVDVGSSATTVAVYQTRAGFNLTAVAARAGGQRGQQVIAMMTRNGTDIDSIDDFQGKTLCTETAGSMDELFFYRWADEHGIDVEADVDYTYTSEQSWRSAFASGSVDACMLSGVGILRVQNEGLATVHEWMDRADYRTAFVVVPDRMVEEEPDKLRRFLTAYAKAADYVRDNPEERIENVAKYTGLSEDLLRQTSLSPVPRDLRVNLTLIEQVQSDMQQYGLIDDTYDMSGFVDNTAISEVQQDVEGVGPVQ